jgi:prepilin-type N-terminal cleavage/methylation domain-containing protein
MLPRRGFTLIEMLVATGVFLLGFSAAYMLFLAGVRYRTEAAATQRLAFALTSLTAELSLSSGEHAALITNPGDYEGNGLAIETTPSAAEPEDPTDLTKTLLFPYPGLSGVWYRVMACADLHGQKDTATAVAGVLPANTSATLHARILVITVPTDDTTLSFQDLQRRYLRDSTTATTPAAIAAELVDRGLAMQSETVLLRRPSWL